MYPVLSYSYSTSYCYHLTAGTFWAALPTPRAPSPITSFLLIHVPVSSPVFILRHLYSDIPTQISSPRLPRSYLLTFYRHLLRISYHYPSGLSSTFFMAGKRGNLLISLCYFFVPFLYVYLFLRAWTHPTPPLPIP